MSSLSPISSSHLYNTTNTTTTTTSNSNSTSTNSSSNNPNRSTSIIPLSGSAAPRNIASTLNVLSSNSTDPLNRQRDNNSISTTSSNAMLLDPIQRTPLPPTSVDRAMMNVVLSQPLGAHHATIIDDTCSPPVSSGRSSIVRDTPPPAAAALSSSKCDQPSNLEILASSATIVPLPSNMGTLIGSSLVKVFITAFTLVNNL
ncbi:unnamed protein product [Anisakis simplex]|uniref:Uncharacterized protein n=1 Tax=Anisakis simplex TaxID=6269 RepID=A0A3P6NLY1_ANISI|nr:unnamed protein product [Anisakis simplex]